MNYITDFYKLLLIILCLLILLITIQNFSLEFFQNKDTNTDQKPSEVKFTLNKLNNNLEFNWDKNVEEIISKYIIIIYINNQGPYLKIIDATTDERYYTYVYKNISNNSIYKIGILAVSNKGVMSDLNIKEFRSSIKDGNIDKYSHNFNSRIICDPSGKHKIVDVCKNQKNEIIATNKLSDKTIYYFNDDEHQLLMDSLNKPTKLDFII